MSRIAYLLLSSWTTACSVVGEWKRTTCFFVISIPESSSRASSAFSLIVNESAALFVGLRILIFLLADISSIVTTVSSYVLPVPHGPLTSPKLLGAFPRYSKPAN